MFVILKPSAVEWSPQRLGPLALFALQPSPAFLYSSPRVPSTSLKVYRLPQTNMNLFPKGQRQRSFLKGFHCLPRSSGREMLGTPDSTESRPLDPKVGSVVEFRHASGKKRCWACSRQEMFRGFGYKLGSSMPQVSAGVPASPCFSSQRFGNSSLGNVLALNPKRTALKSEPEYSVAGCWLCFQWNPDGLFC